MNEVVFVGTSDAFGAGGRRQAAILLRLAGGSVLLDCGTTTATGLVDLGIERDELDAILVSHFHGDHFGGIPALLLAALYEDERKRALRIAGPPGVKDYVHELARAMGYAIEEREWSFPIVFDELPAGREHELGPLSVRSFETLHQPHTHPHGLVVASAGCKVAYSGDTGWYDDLPRDVAEADVFISECTYLTEGFGLHLSHEELARTRSEFHCGRMVLTHLGTEMCEARDRLDFEVADDGLAIRI